MQSKNYKLGHATAGTRLNKVADSFGLIFLTPAQSSSAVPVVSRDPRNQKLFNIEEINMNLLKTTKSIEEVKTQIDDFFKTNETKRIFLLRNNKDSDPSRCGLSNTGGR